MAQAKMARSAPILQVRDVVASERFYREKLGFWPGNFWGEPPCFCITGRDQVTVFFDQSYEADTPIPRNQQWAAYIYVDDVDAYHAELVERGVDVLRGPETADYGCREIDVKDPDGHVIAFGQDLTPGPDGPGL